MCGIVGWIDRGGVDPHAIDRALETLNRRGPDGSGRWTSPDGTATLGHRRLAILDVTVRGEEPSVAPDGASAFIHNGEIYNFRKLRADLEAKGERFLSTSDGEVAHRLLRREGPAALDAIDGMFALALWNDRERRLLLARDRLGIKPLYYATLPGGFAFASEPKAILALPGVSARVDPDALSDFLSYGYVPFDRCLFAGIRKLPPGHLLLHDGRSGETRVEPFWSLEASRRTVRDDPEELRERLRTAVTSQLVSDVPVGAFLSGGLDSTTVVACAAREQPGLPTFTIAFRDGDQSDWEHARVASAALGTRHFDRQVDMVGLTDALAEAAEIYDEPLYDSSVLAVAAVAALARSEVKVALTGDGGDEIFGGYGWDETVMRYERRRAGAGAAGRAMLSSLYGGVVEPLSASPRASRLAGSARLLAPEFVDRYFPVRGFFNKTEQARILGKTPDDPAWLFRKFDRPDLPLAHRLLFLDLHTYLPDNGLMKVDRSTMAVGLEARVPLLDRQLVEYAFSLPAERLLEPGRTKIAFRQAIEPWLPKSILERSKAGFSTPFKKWVGGGNREKMFAILEKGDLAADGVVRPAEVRRFIESGTQRRHNKLWLLLNLEAWYRRWIRGKRA